MLLGSAVAVARCRRSPRSPPSPEPAPTDRHRRPTAPVVTANEFLPTDRDLTDCVGVLEKPGCGSEERGGAATTVVFVVMLLAMALIFGRIAIGVRQNRRAIDP